LLFSMTIPSRIWWLAAQLDHTPLCAGSLLLSMTTPPDQAEAVARAVLREVCPSAHQVRGVLC